MKEAATVTPSGRIAAQRQEAARYVIYFLLIFTVLYIVYQYLEAQKMLAGYHAWLAASVARIFHFLDPEVQAVNNLILYKGNPSLKIITDCDGVAFICLVVAAVLPFARTIRSRILGLIVLIPVLLVLNWLRIVILSVLRFYYPDLFQFTHLYVFQPIMILVTVISFLLWIIASESPSAAR